ncbi:MAG: maleylpyruvate isomerase family mycothiol-dependent enzyme [Actinomycetota bacterium]
MTPEENIAALRRDGAAFAAAARGALDRNVPSCPEWSVSDLLMHTGGVHRHRIWLITEHPEGPEGFDIDDVPDDEKVDWFTDGVEQLARVFESEDPARHVWTWFPADQTVGFWQRRMAQETAVHRWDAENAVGRAHPITPPALAADGIAEFFDTMLPDQEVAPTGSGETIHVHATDVPAEWLVTLTPEGARIEPTHAKGDAAIRGEASDVLLALWRRIPLERVEVLGDRSLAERFIAAMDLS